MLSVVGRLGWADLEHARVPEAASVLEVVSQAVGDARFAAGEVDDARRQEVVRAIDLALVDAFGVWVAGWDWAASEPAGGGLVSAWCCPQHSVLQRDENGITPTVKRAVSAVLEWATTLEELGRRFAALHDETDALPLDEATMRAASRLLPVVLQRTAASDAWYNTFTIVLSWYLESAGHRPSEVRAAVYQVVRGRFESWISPSEETVRDTFALLGRAVAEADGTEMPVDALDAWLRSRAKVIQMGIRTREPPSIADDRHRAYIDRVDRERAPDRADRMLAALDAARAWARSSEPLSFAELSAWQGLVLGSDPPAFRTGIAFAKGGREQYGYDASLPKRFDRCLAQALDPAAPWEIRAARLYLDVCFFHPFLDGNARAARIALDALLTRDHRALHAVAPVAVLARSATNPHELPNLAMLLVYVTAPIGR